MHGFFFQYSGISFLNYISVYLAVLVYALVMSKFVVAYRVVPQPVAA